MAKRPSARMRDKTPKASAPKVEVQRISPQIGPQLDAILADWCTELLFGGARGGGKTFFLLMDYLKDVPKYGRHWKGIFFRRSYTELDEVIKESHKMFPLAGGTYAVQPKEWTFPNGASLKFRYLERDSDAESYQGHQYCVAVGTPILMADGSSCPIEKIKVGDFVQTLEGPKKVKHVVKPYRAFCVSAKGKTGEQIHPVWHRVLTDSGWQSYTSVLGICAKGIEEAFLRGDKLPSLSVNARFFQPPLSQEKNPQPHDSSIRCYAGDKLYKLFGESILKPFQPLLRSCSNLLQKLLSALQNLFYKPLPFFADDNSYALSDLGTSEDSLSSYLCDFHLRDEQLQSQLKISPRLAPLQGDVGERSQSDYKQDVLGSALGHKFQYSSYEHPYTGEIRNTVFDSYLDSLSLTPIGFCDVADISIAGANHYINANTLAISSNTWIGWDELGNYPTDGPYRTLMACLRSAEAEIPTKRIRASANPGGPGHHWVYQYFIERNPEGFVPYDDPVSMMSRMFIPSKVTDNKILMERDPGYISRLKAVGSEALVRAWLEGDWLAIQGAFFDCFNPSLHILDPFTVPSHWPQWVACDWGYAKPFSVGWYTKSDSSMEDIGIPNDSIIRTNEWYGYNGPNKGIRLNIDKFAQGIGDKTKSPIQYLVCDPSMFIQDGGPSLAEIMMRPPYNLPCIRGDNKRVPGWGLVRNRLTGGSDGKPKLFFFPNNTHLLRTLPIMQHSKKTGTNKAEDLNTEMEDHCVDELRYSIMSRINPPKDILAAQPMKTIYNTTMNEFWKSHDEFVVRGVKF